MKKLKRATAAMPAAAAPRNALSWQAAHPFFKPTRRGAQIHAAHLAHLQHAARIALANVADPEARATLADIVEDAGRVLSLCGRAAP
jgi:hypothetical protein